MKRNSWRPARLTHIDHWLIFTALTAIPYVRGSDYLTGRDKGTPLAIMEDFLPLPCWSVAFIGGAAILTLGMLLRIHIIVYAGHSVLAVTYSVLTLGLAAGYVATPYADGIRSLGPLTLVTILHWTIWLRTGPRPLHPGDAGRTVERIEAP